MRTRTGTWTTVLAGTGLLVGALPDAGACQRVEGLGDAIQLLVPTAAFAATAVLDDVPGMSQLFLSFGATFVATHTIKLAIENERPNGMGADSFPSGHTSAAFHGAAFIHFRYGIGYALPAYAGATYVAFSRVYADKHYIEDVLAGAALAIGLTAWITDPFDGVAVRPVTTPTGATGLGIWVRTR